MKVVDLKYKYIFVCICLLGTFLCGYNIKQWYATNNRVKKYISLIYSFSRDEIGHGNFEELVKEEFRKKGIEPVFDRIYLDCDCPLLETGIEDTRKYLEIIKNKPLDLILTIGDQAAFALLSTHHQLLNSIPTVACNVHFPDEKLIKEYETRKIYVLRDTPDFKRNMDFIKLLQPHANMEIIYNIDLTPLGYKSFDLLNHIVDRKDVQVLSPEGTFAVEDEYKEIEEMIHYYSLMPALANENMKKNELTITLCPFRYIKGGSLLVMMKKSKTEQGKRAFLLDKYDYVSLPIVSALNIPSFSCIREGFGEDIKIVGGYMATDEISAKAATNLSVRLFNREKIGMPKIRDLGKEYVIDWKYFSAYSGYDVDNVPGNVRIINYPFHDRYYRQLYILGGLFIVAFVVVSIVLLRIYRRSLIEHKNLKMLKEAHDRLTLSAGGGQISLWNMHENEVEFDDNFELLTGLKKRHFEKAAFERYAHPDDVKLMHSFSDALYESPGTYVQRVRLCFTGNEDYRWYELRCRSMKDVEGEMMLAGIMQDIQELVEREHQLVLAKKMAERAELKQSFLNNMSHEIRTPLNAIVGFTNLLASEDGAEISQEEKTDMLRLINHNNELLLKLINDVLEISHLDSGSIDFEIKRWDMRKVVKEIYKNYRSLIDPSLLFHLEMNGEDPILVNIDRLRFIQVISNFLNNANKFTQSGFIELGCKVDKVLKEVCVYVKDSGKGIDERELVVIFDRFYKTDEFEQGSGLGLPICNVIIEKLEGRIEVQSEVGKGSCFSVFLALADTTSATTEP